MRSTPPHTGDANQPAHPLGIPHVWSSDIRLLATILVLTLLFLALAAEGHARGPAREQAAWQFRYRVWLPANWRSVAQCETGLNWHHHNSSYVSAFGIQRGHLGGQYDDDARRAGMPPWNDARPPTPWQQYRTALSHYRRFGDGWGCAGP